MIVVCVGSTATNWGEFLFIEEFLQVLFYEIDTLLLQLKYDVTTDDCHRFTYFERQIVSVRKTEF